MNVRDGYKMTELGEIPVEWESDLLLNVAQIVCGGTPSTDIEEYWESGDIPWATPTDITSNGKYISKTSKHITTQGLSNSAASLLPAGTILMTSRATIGACSINTIPMTTNQGFKSLISGSKSYNEFLYYTILNRSNELKKLSSGSTFTEISKKSMENLIVAVPPLQEQKKIADILSTVDEHISETESLIEKTKVLKQGMMQQLLTKGIGHTEFKDTEIGRIPVEWEVVKLGKVINQISRPTERPHEPYTSLGIRSHGKGTFSRWIELPENVKMDTLFITRTNDLIVNITFAWEHAIAIVGKEHDGLLVSHRFPTYIIDTSIIAVDFLRRLILEESFRLKMELISPGGAGRNRVLNKKDFLEILIKLPPRNEQEKIASVITAIDDQIDTYQTKLTVLTKLKSALMQQLLTGKTRVKV